MKETCLEVSVIDNTQSESPRSLTWVLFYETFVISLWNHCPFVAANKSMATLIPLIFPQDLNLIQKLSFLLAPEVSFSICL